MHVAVTPVPPGVDQSYFASRQLSFAELATSHALMQQVIARLGLDLTTDQLAGKIHARARGDDHDAVITITVVDRDPAVAQRIAQGVSDIYATYLAGLEMTPTEVTVIDPASYDPDKVVCGA